MRTIVLLMSAVLLSATAYAESFKVDTEHAEIGFTVKHLMLSDVKGGFNTFEGRIDYDLTTKTLTAMEGFIDAASIDTNSEKRDNHLRADDFFNVAQYPRIQFKSTSVEKTGNNTFSVHGTLNILGAERNVVLPVSVAGPIDDPWGNTRIGLSCKTQLNRRELGIENSPAAVIGDEVSVDISAEAVYRAAGGQ